MDSKEDEMIQYLEMIARQIDAQLSMEAGLSTYFPDTYNMLQIWYDGILNMIEKMLESKRVGCSSIG